MSATRIVTARNVGIAGIALGAVALWLALPPLDAAHRRSVRSSSDHSRRSSAWARSRVARNASVGVPSSPGSLGWSAAWPLRQASSSHLEDVITWSTIVSLALVWTTPLTFAAIGGLVSERSGVVNIGLEGMMLMGAFFGIWGADVTGSWFGGLVIGMIAGGALALVHAVFAIHLRADQIVSGTAVIFIAYGITGYLYNSHYGFEGTPGTTPTVPQYSLTWLGRIPPSHSASSFRTRSSDISLMTIVADPTRATRLARHLPDTPRASDSLMRRAPACG